MGIVAISGIEKYLKGELRLKSAWISLSQRQKTAFVCLFLFFFFIQIEWIAMRIFGGC
jgi:hypothetical protein